MIQRAKIFLGICVEIFCPACDGDRVGGERYFIIF